MSAVFQLTVKASGLPNYRLFQTPNCYARITIDGELSFVTKTISGPRPEWHDFFDISLREDSTIKVQLFHVGPSSEEVAYGLASISVTGSLSRENQSISFQHKLHEANTKFRKGGSIVVSLCRKPLERPSPSASDIVGPKLPKTMPTSKIGHQLPDTPDKDEVLADVGRAEEAVGKNKGHDETTAISSKTTTSTDLFRTVLGYVEKIVKYGDVVSQVHPYAQLAWSVLTVAQKAVSGQVYRDDKITTLLITIRDMLEFVEEADAISKISKLQDTVSLMMAEIHECARFIQKYGEKGLGTRIIRDTLSTATEERIDQFMTTFDRLKEKFHQGINIHTFNVIRQLAPLLEDAESEKQLEGLPGWNLKGVRFNESKVCLNGTRTQILDSIRTWAYSTSEERLLWLSGGAGTGKTSVATSIAVFFDNIGRLGACFCFNRDTAGLNNSDGLFGNLCYQLAHFDAHGQFGIKSAILSVVRLMGYIPSSSLQTQAKRLLVNTVNAADLDQPIVVVIDALDESGTTEERKELLDAISTEFPKLPPSLKVVITSRDEPDLRASLQHCSKEICIGDAENTREDIASYIDHRFGLIRHRSRLSEHWPGTDKSRELATRAGQLFIWASVACNFVEERRDPIRRLDILLDLTAGLEGKARSPLKKLEILYNSVLRNAFPDEDDPLTDFRYVIGSIVTLETPLTQIGLDSLLGLGYGADGDFSILQNGQDVHLTSSDVIISLLRSILRTDPAASGKEGPLRLLHPSIHEFLTSGVNETFRIDPLEQNRILATRCISIMNRQLRFDICKIGDPSLLNKEIANLSARIDHYIPEELRYSCCSIGYHLTKVPDPDQALINALNDFLSEHLLHWIEAMSLLGEIRKAEDCLLTLSEWVKGSINDSHVQALVGDAIPFLRNSGYAIRLSALHTYHSALPLAPKTTALFKSFSCELPHIPDIMSSHPTWPTVSVRVLEAHTDGVIHVVFSPDGKILASASYDKTVQLWDVESGEAIGESFKGHTERVCCLAFSPDGKKVASASDDGTIWLWDIVNATGEVLKGHIDKVIHVCFSPDGKKLVSASSDKVVRTFDVASRKLVGKPFKSRPEWVNDVIFSQDGQKLVTASCDQTVWFWEIVVESGEVDTAKAFNGHTEWVQCAVFSPDGSMLASVSDDQTVRLWDVENRHAIGEPLRSQIDFVHHIVFSPDGKRLALASNKNMIQLWDVENGRPIWEALEAHTEEIRHVAFSPDGTKLASASDDRVVRLWDIERGQTMGDALVGHTKEVRHVVFSPDGSKLASASFDSTVRLWDVADGQAIGGAFEGHADWVNHAAFSPDGKKLASASHDHTVRLWGVESGQAVGDALKGHNDCVRHVVFSPDGKRLASTSDDQTVRLWDVESGAAIGGALQGHTNWVLRAVFSPDGRKLASASDDQTVWLWDAKTGQAIKEVINGHASCTHDVVFSSDGQKLASTSNGNIVQLWNVESGKVIGRSLKNSTSGIHHVTFSPDGKKLASTSYDYTAQLWDVQSGQVIGGVLKGATNVISKVVFSPDGKKLASASYDNTLRLWNVEDSSIISILKTHTSRLFHVTFSPDGKSLAVADDWTVELWDVESGKALGSALKSHTDWICHLTFSPNGKKLASASHDKTARLWDIESIKTISEAPQVHTSAVYRIAFSPDGALLASVSSDQLVRFWDVESGKPFGAALAAHTGRIEYAVFSPDGKKLVSASEDGALQLWDSQSGQTIGENLKGHTSGVKHLAFSPDGRTIVSASDDLTVRLWDIGSDQAVVGQALTGHTSKVRHVMFSPDGKKLVSTSYDVATRQLWLWDIADDRVVGEALNGHSHQINHVSFSPDGKMLASVSYDRTLRLWDVASGQAIGKPFEGHTSGIRHVAFSPDGKKLASASYDETVRLWDVEKGNVRPALEGRTNWFNLVVFSPDGKQLAAVSDDRRVQIWNVETGQTLGDASDPYGDHVPPSETALQNLDIMRERWIKDFIGSNHNDSDRGMIKRISDTLDKILEPTLFFDEQGYLRHGSTRLSWLPSVLRGREIAIKSSTIAVGSVSGAVTIIKFPPAV